MSENVEDRAVPLRRVSPVITAPTALVTVLQILAVALVVGGLAQGGATLQAAPSSPEPAIGALLAALGWAVAGCSAAALLWSLGWLIRRQYCAAVIQQRMLRAIEAGGGPDVVHPPLALRPPGHGDGQPVDPDDHIELLQRLVSEVMEMNANVLMSQPQREAKGLRRQERLAVDLLAAFEKALAGHEFAHAEACIGQFEAELPADPRLGEMESRLSEARAAVEARDVEAETQQVDDLMAVASFDDAQLVADGLLAAYPGSQSAQALVERVRREATVFFREQRERLYGEVQRNADARRWRQALEAASQLVQAHPGSAEADAAKSMLATLEDNARIEEVRQLRDDFRDMIKRRRYAEALEIAHDVLERFPSTQAASDLRGQIGRLRELAAEEGR